MPAWLLVVLVVAATARLTRFVTADRLSAPVRDRLLDRWGENSLRGYLLSCDYCVSMYVAPLVAAVGVLWPDNRVVVIVLIALSASMVAGYVAAHE